VNTTLGKKAKESKIKYPIHPGTRGWRSFILIYQGNPRNLGKASMIFLTKRGKRQTIEGVPLVKGKKVISITTALGKERVGKIQKPQGHS